MRKRNNTITASRPARDTQAGRFYPGPFAPQRINLFLSG